MSTALKPKFHIESTLGLNADDVQQAYQIFCSHREHAWGVSLFEQSLATPYSFCARHYDNQGILGYVMISHVLDEAEIEDICVASACRNMGIATALLASSMQCLKQNNMHVVRLEVRESNSAAIALYKKHGFKHIATRNRYYKDSMGADESALIFECSLA